MTIRCENDTCPLGDKREFWCHDTGRLECVRCPGPPEDGMQLLRIRMDEVLKTDILTDEDASLRIPFTSLIRHESSSPLYVDTYSIPITPYQSAGKNWLSLTAHTMVYILRPYPEQLEMTL